MRLSSEDKKRLQFVEENEMKLCDEVGVLIDDAVTVGGLWAGKLSRIDNALQFLHNEMSKGDQNLKDSVFNKYYRYYNDGDVPRFQVKTLTKLGLDKNSAEVLSMGTDPGLSGGLGMRGLN